MLMTHPRSCSTAFERSIFQLQDQVVVEHEPYGTPYYFSGERRTKNPGYLSMPIDAKAGSFESVTKMLTRQMDDSMRVFAKDMGYYIVDESGLPDSEILSSLRDADASFTFLIRDPKKAIPSLDKMQKKLINVYGDRLQKEEVGIRELFAVYRFVKDNLQLPTTVIDADDVINCPEKILPAYCEKVGLAFSEKCLKWEAEIPASWENWAGWHDDAKNSDGFIKRETLSNTTPPDQGMNENDADRARDVAAAIEESSAAYQSMYADKLLG